MGSFIAPRRDTEATVTPGVCLLLATLLLAACTEGKLVDQPADADVAADDSSEPSEPTDTGPEPTPDTTDSTNPGSDTQTHDTADDDTTADSGRPDSCTGANCVDASSTCSNGRKDGAETDVDCGGPNCPACAGGKSCAFDSDCANGDCAGGTCTGKHAWKTGDWGECSVACGDGTQSRSVECIDETDGGSVPDSNCPSPKPKSERSCTAGSCWFDVDRTYAESGSDAGNHDIAYPGQSPSGPYSPGSNHRNEGKRFEASARDLGGLQPIYHCSHNRDTFISHGSNCEGNTTTHNAPIGYLSPTKTSEFDQPIYRCYIPSSTSPLSTGDHFVSRDPDCEIEAAENEDTLGYF